jgi:hypothetical protein
MANSKSSSLFADDNVREEQNTVIAFLLKTNETTTNSFTNFTKLRTTCDKLESKRQKYIVYNGDYVVMPEFVGD